MATEVIERIFNKSAKNTPYGSPAWFVDMVESSKDAPVSAVVDLTPTLAKFMLDVNADNRSVKQVKLAQYSHDMAAGNWRLNGEPLIISSDGNLNDGQHRCLSVIDSNTTVPVLIVFGIDRETRMTVDQGAARTAGDYLDMGGVPNAAMSAAIARNIMAYEMSGGNDLSLSKFVTSADIRARVINDADIAAAATFAASNVAYSRTFCAGSIVGTAFYLLSGVHKDDARQFLERVCRGDGLKMRDPAHTLREKMMSEGRLSRDRKLTLIFKAWNFHRRGIKVSAGSLNKELPFPALM